MREDLIAYVLGDLDDEDRLRIEQELAEDANLRDEVERIRECMLADEVGDCDEVLLPRGLAERTSENILSSGDDQSLTDDLAGSPGSFSMVDMTVALAIFLAVGSLLMPALHGTREDSRRMACTNNLGELGKMFSLYSERHAGLMPLVAPNEHAGIYPVRLAESNVASRGELSRRLVCPASPLGERLRRQNRSLEIPTPQSLVAAEGQLLLRLRRESGGSYAYQIGYVKDGNYIPVLDRGHSWVPILSDAPNVAASRDVGANHNGTYINVLFQDGSVHTLNTCVMARDHIYLNTSGEAAAGDTWSDAVMAPSYAQPGVGHLDIPKPIRIRFFEF